MLCLVIRFKVKINPQMQDAPIRVRLVRRVRIQSQRPVLRDEAVLLHRAGNVLRPAHRVADLGITFGGLLTGSSVS